MPQRPVLDVDAVLPASGAWPLGSSCGACAPVRIWGWFFHLLTSKSCSHLRFHSSMEPPLERRSCASPRAPTNTCMHTHTHTLRRLCLEGAAKRANQTLCLVSSPCASVLPRHHSSVSSFAFREPHADADADNMQSVSEVSVDSPLGVRPRRALEWTRVHHRAAALEAFHRRSTSGPAKKSLPSRWLGKTRPPMWAHVQGLRLPLPISFRWALCDSCGCALIGPQPLAKTGRVLWLWSCGCTLLHLESTITRAPYFISEFFFRKNRKEKDMQGAPEESTSSGPLVKPASLFMATPRGADLLAYLGRRTAHSIARQPLLPCVCMVAQQTGGAESRLMCTRVVCTNALLQLNAPAKHFATNNVDPVYQQNKHASCDKANPSSSAATMKTSKISQHRLIGKEKKQHSQTPPKYRSIDRLHTCKPVPKTNTQHIKNKTKKLSRKKTRVLD
ncbi:hypothetical protein COCMIDRAFT_40886 [Bipolaris oryzae ATCC 44560]|uniref:Uncharacterized protein n=1 Tax=Bipolaris oryzae ATCC 44560 TaxID=930090 RepID=W6ZAV5_COCMI|nr:uncharacterized protein COCMIDRAFT_40886 [Bipolaris oryzae ATCC 44560]EUC40856.1 hypothetical protein COCMIDRAFT_40886 [Bipolaris oryzae ATCC 44560]